MINNYNVCCIVVLFNPNIIELKRTSNKLKKENVYTIYVDNNSSNKEDFVNLGLNIIFLEKNFGIATAHNYGLKQAISENFDFAVLLDQDSDISEYFFKNIIDSFLSIDKNLDNNIVALGPLHFDSNRGCYYGVRLPNFSIVNPMILSEKIIKAQYVISSGSLIKLKKLSEIGFMKDEYFIDYVDIEWGFRVYEKGFSIYIDKNLSINHNIGEECIINGKVKRIHSSVRRYYMVRNSIYLLKERHIPYRYSFKQIYLQLVHSVYLFIFMKSFRFKYLIQTLKGLKDGVRMLFKKT
ncbi:glycosyltransferase family 2 protein [Acinetobacter bouvetii]|uniref:Glycosyl transferase family 2 n=1 Tax=Acinetobacter bouvetii TaxID=202951 RepID=A0A811GF44_9GAMM|nr:glycosyltransferase family 2 protein [Acinetobacter bouvetii]CAB1208101.1 Glycosyl transferase family 2 [Acinetobacter bouvetii]